MALALEMFNPDDVACITACAKATYERLPPELRNLVYEYLWELHGDSATVIFEPPCMAASTAFISSGIVGADFVREAVAWMYEHGCSGHAVSLDRLGAFLFTDAYRVGAVPAACSLRALRVCIDCESLGSSIFTTAIEPHFAPLLCLGLMEDFKLSMCIAITFMRGISVLRLFSMSTVIRRIVREFRAKNSQVAIELDFKQEYPFLFIQRTVQRMVNLADLPNSISPLAHYRIQCREAERMLYAIPQEW